MYVKRIIEYIYIYIYIIYRDILDGFKIFGTQCRDPIYIYRKCLKRLNKGLNIVST